MGTVQRCSILQDLSLRQLQISVPGQRTILGRNATALFVPGRQQSKKADGSEKAKKNVIVARGSKPPGVQAWMRQKTC